MKPLFHLKADYTPTGDQPEAIDKILENLKAGEKHQVLLGVTGSGKTFTMANVIAKAGKPALILAPNKTLAAQLYNEFKEFFPDNAVGYFVSYYDYYQPEAYIPRTDVYIEKDSAINDNIDKMRHKATHDLLSRNDVIIVASVSCIYGLGSPEAYQGMLIDMEKGMNVTRRAIVNKLLEIQYKRNDVDFHRGTFRIRGDVLDIFPPYEDERAIRIEFFDDEIDSICSIDALKGSKIETLSRIAIYPGSHYVANQDSTNNALKAIEDELKNQITYFRQNNSLLEMQRIEQRTRYDLEMIREIGFCSGIENYSRHFEGRAQGLPPPTLLQYFPKDFLLFVDESHISIPQIGGMFKGDRARKETLVNFGFRLPSALDNRPLTFDEFEKTVNQAIYVSATPGPYELDKSKHNIVEQVVRPTGLIDPVITIKKATGQVDDLIQEIHKTVEKKERVLVTTLTKRMAENLSRYFKEANIRSKYLHSDIDTVERFEILRDLRKGEFDVLIGINLLREGLDLPEVSLVAILDGDKEGFLRSTRSLIQTFGRAARNAEGRVIVYADQMTQSLNQALLETNRRREIQLQYNQKHGIIPTTIIKGIAEELYKTAKADYFDVDALLPPSFQNINVKDISKKVTALEKEMKEKVKLMDFEKAALIRDEIRQLKEIELTLRN